MYIHALLSLTDTTEDIILVVAVVGVVVAAVVGGGSRDLQTSQRGRFTEVMEGSGDPGNKATEVIGMGVGTGVGRGGEVGVEREGRGGEVGVEIGGGVEVEIGVGK